MWISEPLEFIGLRKHQQLRLDRDVKSPEHGSQVTAAGFELKLHLALFDAPIQLGHRVLRRAFMIFNGRLVEPALKHALQISKGRYSTEAERNGKESGTADPRRRHPE